MKICPQCKLDKEDSEYNKRKNGALGSWCKKCLYKKQHERWKAIKLKSIDLLGGKCLKCGYCKNAAALDFHHRDPLTKEANWGRIAKKKWETIIKELKKCDLLCKNCHSETHNPRMNIELLREENIKACSILEKEDEEFKSLKMKPSGTCRNIGCSAEVYGTKFCSRTCSSYFNRKVKRPSCSELKSLINSNCNWTELGKRYGVSDNAVRKWAKAYGIDSKSEG